MKAISILLLVIISHPLWKPSVSADHIQPDRKFRIVFYNAENFFDTYNDSLTADDDFTPDGNLHWTTNRYHTKLSHLTKVVIATGGWQPPDVIGLCEVENKAVLEDLFLNTGLSKFNYEIIHRNSDDARGIDVALIYRRNTVRLIDSSFYSLRGRGYITRDILYFKALLEDDTCHFFVNHWPSRSGGQLETEPARIAAAGLLKSLVDSVLQYNPSGKVIIMGDFNDEPQDVSLSDTLNAETQFSVPVSGLLYNLAHPVDMTGTIKYRGIWTVFDQFIVSGSLLTDEIGLQTGTAQYHIFNEDFLLMDDAQYTGKKPFRTYNGYRYLGGFSDHLPVILDLY